MRIAASVFVTIFLLCLCAVLAGPAFDLPAFDHRGNLAAGAAPRFVLIAVAGFSLASLAGDLLALRKNRPGGDGAPEDGAGYSADGREVLLIGGAVLGLLTLYVALWRFIGFPAASALFMLATSVVISPKSARTPVGFAIMAATAVIFSILVWLAFTRLLGVPLR